MKTLEGFKYEFAVNYMSITVLKNFEDCIQKHTKNE